MMQLQSTYALIRSCDCGAKIRNAEKEGESAGERRRETSMFVCGVGLSVVDHLTDGCWHSCV